MRDSILRRLRREIQGKADPREAGRRQSSGRACGRPPLRAGEASVDAVDAVIRALQRHKDGGGGTGERDEGSKSEEEVELEGDEAETVCGGPQRCRDVLCARCPVPRRSYGADGTCHRVVERDGRYVHLVG